MASLGDKQNMSFSSLPDTLLSEDLLQRQELIKFRRLTDSQNTKRALVGERMKTQDKGQRRYMWAVPKC